MNDLKQDILHTIEEQQVEPSARWQFVLKNYAVWLLAAAALLLAGVSVSVLIFATQNSDFAVRREFGGGFFATVLQILPFVWIMLLAIFVVLADVLLRQTKRGYKYRLIGISIISVFVSGLLGTGLYAAGASHALETTLERFVPGYRHSLERREEFWLQPEEGRLAGEVGETQADGQVLFVAFDDTNWLIDTGELSERDNYALEKFTSVALMGEVRESGVFAACLVKPWEVRGKSGLVRERFDRITLSDDPAGPGARRRPELVGIDPRQIRDFDLEFEKKRFGERKFDEVRSSECGGKKDRRAPRNSDVQ